MQPDGPEARQRALVTGGTDGIGKEVARALARAGRAVTIVGRDEAKGARAAHELRATTGNEQVDCIAADVSLAREVDRLARIAAEGGGLRYLVHSAGVVLGRYALTEEAVERNFATNYLSRFTLTRRLLPLLQAAGTKNAAARIVIIGGAAQHGRIFFDDVNLTRNFSTLRAVAQFCRANDVFTIELARRLEEAAAPVTVACLKIGVVKTAIRRNFPWWMKLLVPLLFDPLLGQTPEAAAESAVRLLLAPEFEGANGALYSQIRRFKRLAPSSSVRDRAVAERLWTLSERLAGDPHAADAAD